MTDVSRCDPVIERERRTGIRARSTQLAGQRRAMGSGNDTARKLCGHIGYETRSHSKRTTVYDQIETEVRRQQLVPAIGWKSSARARSMTIAIKGRAVNLDVTAKKQIAAAKAREPEVEIEIGEGQGDVVVVKRKVATGDGQIHPS